MGSCEKNSKVSHFITFKIRGASSDSGAVSARGLNEIIGSLHIHLDDKYKTAKRIYVFHGNVYEIAIYEEEIDPMKYRIIDRFAAYVIEVVLIYYASTGHPA